MARYADADNAGRSARAPFRPGEQPASRHARRKAVAQRDHDALDAWCDEHGAILRVNNDGHHWIIDGIIHAEWWPSSAKLVIERQWQHGIHCHDVFQVIGQLNAYILSSRIDHVMDQGR